MSNWNFLRITSVVFFELMRKVLAWPFSHPSIILICATPTSSPPLYPLILIYQVSPYPMIRIITGMSDCRMDWMALHALIVPSVQSVSYSSNTLMANSSTSWNIAQHINKDHINCHSDKNTGKILLFSPWICVFEVKSDKIHKNGIYLFLINFHFLWL